MAAAVPKVHPYLCYGFKIEDAIVYISDVSFIPEDVWSMVLTSKSSSGQIPAFIVDCLRLNPHTSHFGLKQAVAAVRRLGAKRSYLTGFGHEVTHEEYTEILTAIGNPSKLLPGSSENIEAGLKLVGEGKEQYVRPAYDGMRIFVSVEGNIRDDED